MVDTTKVINVAGGQMAIQCDEHGLLAETDNPLEAWHLADQHARKAHGAAYAGADAAIEPYESPDDGR